MMEREVMRDMQEGMPENMEIMVKMKDTKETKNAAGVKAPPLKKTGTVPAAK